MSETNIMSNNAEMLLTSVGSTTDAMRDCMLGLAKKAGRPARLNILRIADGWANFDRNDGTTRGERARQRFEAWSARKWSDTCLKYVLGNVTVDNIYAGQYCRSMFEKRLKNADMLLVPGGNTYLAMRGLAPHAENIGRLVAHGLPYIGDSAGTIISGASIRPATLEPADTRPDVPNLDETGLGLLGADIVTHGVGRKSKICVGGLKAAIADRIFRKWETQQSVFDAYRLGREAEGVDVYILNDEQALSVSGPEVTVI